MFINKGMVISYAVQGRGEGVMSRLVQGRDRMVMSISSSHRVEKGSDRLVMSRSSSSRVEQGCDRMVMSMSSSYSRNRDVAGWGCLGWWEGVVQVWLHKGCVGVGFVMWEDVRLQHILE